MAKEKIINETTIFPDFIKIIKKITAITTEPIIILPNGEWIIRRKHVESFIRITEPNIRNYYTWAIIDPVGLLECIKNYKIKKTGVRIEDLSNSVKIFKNDELVYEIKKLDDPDIGIRKSQAVQGLKLMPGLSLIFDDATDYTEVSKDLVTRLSDGNAISLYTSKDDSPIILSKELFPLSNEVLHFLFRKIGPYMGKDLCAAGIIEKYPSFDINTVLLYIDIR